MSPITVSNLDQAEAWEASGGILPPGKHNVTIVDVTEGTSSGGYPQIELQHEAADGLGIRDWIVVIPQTYGKVVQLLNAAGVPVPTGDAVLNTFALKGRKVFVTVAEQPDNKGEKRNRVVAYEPTTGVSDLGSTPVASGVPTGIAGPVSNDDIPF